MLPPDTAALQRRFGWLYWVDEEHDVFGSPDAAALPSLIDNLELLTRHRIHQARHLRGLAGLLVGPPLEQRADVMAILNSTQQAFQKSDRLKMLAGAASPRKQDY